MPVQHKVRVYTEYNRYLRVLTFKADGGTTVKIYGDPAKALAVALLVGRRAERLPEKSGFLIEMSEEELYAIKALATSRISWKTIAEQGLLEHPEKIVPFISLKSLLK